MACGFEEQMESNLGRLVAQTDLAIAILTFQPITPGHTVIWPRRCVANYESLTAEEQRDIFGVLMSQVKEALTAHFGYQEFNHAWNQGPVAGQSVPHFHLHVIGRQKGDAGIHGYEPRQFIYRPNTRAKTPPEELESLAAVLRNG